MIYMISSSAVKKCYQKNRGWFLPLRNTQAICIMGQFYSHKNASICYKFFPLHSNKPNPFWSNSALFSGKSDITRSKNYNFLEAWINSKKILNGIQKRYWSEKTGSKDSFNKFEGSEGFPKLLLFFFTF